MHYHKLLSLSLILFFNCKVLMSQINLYESVFDIEILLSWSLRYVYFNDSIKSAILQSLQSVHYLMWFELGNSLYEIVCSK